MAALSAEHRVVIDQLVERCPDVMLSKLARMTLGMPGAKAQALAEVLNGAALDRRRRAFALGAVGPLFAPRGDGVEALAFPPSVFARLWAEARAREDANLALLDEEDASALVVAERMCRAASAAVRDQPALVWPATLAPDRREAGLRDLAACLDLAFLARKGVALLPALIGRPTGDQLAELRLLIKDAAAVAPDGARRMLDILFAHLADASLVLRVVTQSSAAAGRESFLSASELAVYVERLLDQVNIRVERVAAFNPAAGDAVQRLSADIVWCSTVLQELDLTLKLQPDSAWGQSVRAARGRVGAQLTSLMKAGEKALDAALPLSRMQVAGRMTRPGPQLEADPDSPAVARARTLLTAVTATRASASAYGVEGDRKKLVERLTERLSSYADEALDMINAGDAPDETRAVRLVETAALLLHTMEATDLARSLRRRAAVAGTADVGPSPVAA